MNSRALILVLIFACAAFPCALFPAASAPEKPAETVIKLDGKILYIPEIKLTQGANPVDTVLFIGSWETKGRMNVNQNPLCAIDLDSNSLTIESPGKLLKNSKTQVVNRDTLDAFLKGITWARRQATHFAFAAVSNKRQPAVIELSTESDTVVFNNGNMASRVSAVRGIESGGHCYFPVMLEEGGNIINIKQYSIGSPRIQASVSLDHKQDLRAAWQTLGTLLKNRVEMATGRSGIPVLDWNANLGNTFTVSMEVRDVSADKIVFQRDTVRRGRLFSDDGQMLAPGIYKAVYRARNDSASELFIVGNPEKLFAELQEKLSQYNPSQQSKLDIEAQQSMARFLLSKDNYNILDVKWQEKIAYALSSLAAIERGLKDGAVNIAKDQSGIHIRSYVSGADGSVQAYRLFVPPDYKPGAPLPLVVMAPVRIANKEKPFIEGPVMENHRQAVLWSKPAAKYGVAVLWPPYRSAPEGYSYESVNIMEAIQAVEKDYNIDRVSIYATCGAGYTAGRLVAEFPNRFAGIVYDRAVFDLSLETIKSSPSLMEWYATVNPSRRVIANRNIKIFVMHDDTRPEGHGPMELTTRFLEQASRSRNDVVSYLSKQPMSQASRMDMTLSWLASCRNENPDDKRSYFLAKAGYTGPIMEIFATPLLVVEGTQAQGVDLDNIKAVVESLKKDYAKHFHGAECAVRKDTDVTQDDIKNHSLILVGNPKSNSVWEKLQSRLPVKVTSASVMYENDRLTGFQPFQAIARHPDANDKYILMIGAGDLRTLGQAETDNLFTAWYDCLLFAPRKIISKLDSLHDTRASAQNPKLQNPKSQKPKPQNH